MKFKSKATLAGCENKKNKAEEIYCIVRLIESSGKIFELITKDNKLITAVNAIPQFSQVEIEVDIQQGKYPKFILLDMKK